MLGSYPGTGVGSDVALEPVLIGAEMVEWGMVVVGGGVEFGGTGSSMGEG